MFCGPPEVTMADNVSRWVWFELSGSANFGPICSKLEQSVAEVMMVAVEWSAAVGALF